MTTFIEELNDALHTIKAVDHEEPLIDENGKRWGVRHYTLIDEESIEVAAQAILNLVSERIIKGNQEDCSKTWDCTCIRHEQLDRLYEGTKEDKR